ncbi:response regulator transcription factor [Clostridium tertium]|jgi:DNA-binding response OmpR family regulator|uniref:Stage 0 sporulation protein A homolog n=1 Tax=Clostridium tertium TaxID=1559 RepID=A0A9X3XM98_9CLOT|nr:MULTISPECIES: response regulator transcription factor [Clostridium]MDB1922758.1 response regulator transcription factor [Clostridium tertium]MDB1925823.1 response regulator transcription factor [Clostridium tertium]MDB1929114.1 response regulator transcription factor [Clostridium tertium]MDB1941954.1 response regulator transcription factor [Clostridium tertium]MDC4241758.1 response regulator transcription factor [Clostridium tertium]
MDTKKIFIIEDEEKIRNELCTFLNKYGYETSYSLDFENILEEFMKDKYHLVLLDINLPYYDGYYICREIRKRSSIPIIVVTSRDSEVDELMSMNLGADDFITKPYNTQILLARISSIIRRAYNNSDSEVLEYRGLIHNLSTSEAEFDNKRIELSKNESRILYVLIKNKEKIVSRNEIIESLWQSDEFVDDNTLTVNINRLRKKLEEIGAIDYLKTKRGQGYILICD